MSPPFDAAYAQTPSAFGAPAETPEERQQRLRRERFTAYNERMSPSKPPQEAAVSPEASPPLVPSSTTQLTPKRSGALAPTPAAAFATEPERAYPGVSADLGLARDAPLQGVPDDASAAIRASAARHEERVGLPAAETLGPAEAPPQYPADRGGIPEAEDGYWETLGRGLLSRTGDITAGFTQTLSDATQAAALGMGDNQAGAATQGLSDFFMTSTEWLDDIQSESYKPKYDDVGEALEKAKNLDFGYLLGFIAEQAPLTLADALTSLAGAPLYLIATTGDFAAERAENDGRSREELTAKDYTYGAAAAATSFVLDKILLGQGGKLAEGMLGKEAVKQLADFGSSTTMRRVLTSGLRGAASESVEESAQQALTTVDTEKGATVEDIALAGIGGALAGGPAAAGFDVFAGHPSTRGIPEPDPEQDVSADARAAIEAQAGAEKPMQGPMPLGPMQGPQLPAPPSVPEPPPMQGPTLPAPPSVPGRPPPMQGPTLPAPPSVPGRPPPAVTEQVLPSDEDVDETAAIPEGATPESVAAATGQQLGERDALGNLIERPRSEQERLVREEYAPDKPKQEKGESDEDYQRRLEGWHRQIEEHEKLLEEQETGAWKQHEAARKAIIKKDRKAPHVTTGTAAYSYLKRMHENRRGGIPGSQNVHGRADRDELALMYRNLSDAGRVLSEQMKSYVDSVGKGAGWQPFEIQRLRRMVKELTTNATWMANARDDVMQFSEAPDQEPGGPRQETSFDRAYANFQLVDPNLMTGLGLAPDFLTKAAIQEDPEVLHKAIVEVKQKAIAQVQKYEAKRTHKEKTEEGRVELPELEGQGKKEPVLVRLTKFQTNMLREAARSRSPSKVADALQSITFQRGGVTPKVKDEINAILVDMGDVSPPGGRQPKSAPVALAESMRLDLRPVIRGEGLTDWKVNPDYGQPIKLTDEDRAERKALAAEEARYKGKQGFRDTEKVVTAKGPAGQVNVEKISRNAAQLEHEAVQARKAYETAAADFDTAQQAFVDDPSAEVAGALQQAWNVRQQAGQDWMKASQAAEEAQAVAEQRHPRVAADVAAEMKALAETAQAVVVAYESVVRTSGGNPAAGFMTPALAQRLAHKAASAMKTVTQDVARRLPAAQAAWDDLGPPLGGTARDVLARKAYRDLGGKPGEDTAEDNLVTRLEALRTAAATAAWVADQKVDTAEVVAGLTVARKNEASAKANAEAARKEAARLAGKPMHWVFTTRKPKETALEISALRKGQMPYVTGTLSAVDARIRYMPKTVMKQAFDEKGKLVPGKFEKKVIPPTRIILGKPFAISEAEANRRGAEEEIARANEAAYDAFVAARGQADAAAIDELADELRETPRKTASVREQEERESIKEFMRGRVGTMSEADLEAAAAQIQREADQRKAERDLEKEAKTEEQKAVAEQEKAERRAAAAAKKAANPFREAARDTLDEFKRDVEAGARPGDFERLRALALTIWRNRLDKKWVPKFLWVRDVWNEDEPYNKVYGAMPRINEKALAEGVQRREEGIRTKYKKGTITVFNPNQVEASIGWRFGMTEVSTLDSSPHRASYEGVKPWHKNVVYFSTAKVDQLVSDLMQQVGTDAKTAREMASILLDRAQREGQSRPSGSRAAEYNKANRKARRELEGKGKERQRKPVEPPPTATPTATTVTPGKPDETPAVTPPEELVEVEPMTPEQLAALLAAIQAGTFDNASPATRQHFTSWVTNLKEDIARHQQNLAAAEAMIPVVEQEVSTRQPDDYGVLDYPAPDGWPGEHMQRFWRVKERDGNVVNGFLFQLEPFKGTTDASYHRAVLGYVRHSIEGYRQEMVQLERKLEDALEKWRQGGGTFGGGGGKPGVPVQPIVRVAPTSPGTPGYVDTGVFAPVSSVKRESVDLVGSTKREPYTPDDVFNQFKSFGDKGSVDGEPALTNKYTIGADQKETAARAYHTYKRRLGILARGGAWLTSVNRGGFLGANGTGSGKSIIMAMLAHAISHGQPQTGFKRVLLVHQNGQPDAVRDAMSSLWHHGMDPDDGARWKFIPYSDLADTVKSGEEFAAIIFDEAHWTKAPSSQGDVKDYSPAAAAIKTDFRAFFTATPTDGALQEEYYLRYMLQNIDEPLTVAQAEGRVRERLGTAHKEGETSANFMDKLRRDPRKLFKYVKNLEGMIEEAVANNAVTSYTLAPRLVGEVNQLTDSQIASGVASALATTQQHGQMDQRLNEHAKVEAMVERTLDLIVEGRARGERPGVINVFEYSGRSQKTEKREAYKMQGVGDGLDLDQPATMRMRDLLIKRAEERKIPLKVGMMTGNEGRMRVRGKTMKPSDIAKEFQKGVYDVLIMTDASGGTGINLSDPFGEMTKYMLIGGAKASGQSWIQLMGRTDRKDTVSTPYAEWMAMPNSDHPNHIDKKLRNSIKDRVLIERASIGMSGAVVRGDIDISKLLDQQRTFRKLVKGATPMHSSPVDQVVSERLAGGPVTASSLVADIARNQTDPALAGLAQALVGHPALGSIQVESTVAGHDVLGYAQGRSAYVNVGSGSEAVTAMHEVFHHLSHQAIDDPSPRGDVLRARLTAIMKAVPQELAPMFEGVLTNLHEFATTAHTDPQFRRALKGVKGPSGVTLWQRFKEWMQVVLGIRNRNFSALDAVLELTPSLTDPGTVTEHGSGDVSQQLATVMQRKVRLMPAAVTNIIGRVDQNDRGFKTLLATMTLDQIVDSYGRLSVDPTNEKKPGVNHLQALRDVMDARYAYSVQEREEYDRRILTPLYEWAMEPQGGQREVSVRTTPDGPLEKMPALQYLIAVMNDSGVGKLHLGKDIDDKANALLHPSKHTEPRLVKQKDGSFKTVMPRGRDRSHIIWDLHKNQFDSNGPHGLGEGGRALYNDMAAYFHEQAEVTRSIVAMQFLEIVDPRPDGKPWRSIAPKEVEDRITQLGGMDDADLAKHGIQRKGLETTRALLAPGRVAGAYFPIKRFGEWVVSVRETVNYTDDADKEAKLRHYFGAEDDPDKKQLTYYAVARFENKADGEEWRLQMKEKFPDSKPSNVMLGSDTGVAEESRISESLLTAVAERINAQKGISDGDKRAQIDLFTQSVLDLLPESSFADSFRPRKGVMGMSQDIFRALNAYGSGFAHYKAGAVFATPHREALRGLQGRLYQLERGTTEEGAAARTLRRISNELGERNALLATPFTERQWAQSINNVGFAYYLVSASYNVLNMSQPILITTPYLAGDHGLAAATSAMSRAYRTVGGTPFQRLAKSGFSVTALKGLIPGRRQDFSRKNYDVLTEMKEKLRASGNERHARLLEAMAAKGILDATVAMDMGAEARTSHIDSQGNLKKQGALSYLSEWMKMAPHITEVMNRAVTAVASYDLQYARLMKKPGMNAAEASRLATEYAATAINRTQFDYRPHNKPRIIQGSSVARTLLMFKQHPQHVYYFMISRAIKSSRGLVKKITGQKMTAEEAEEAKVAAKQLAYFVGMHVLAAGAIGGIPEPVKWMIGWLSALFGDDDEPFNYELWVQQSMSDWLGPELGNVAARGLPAGMGVDLSSRIGINSLLMFDTPSAENPDAFLADVFRLAGGPMATLMVERPYQAWTAMQSGDYTKAIEAATPKIIRDPIRAYRVANEGYTTYAGRVYSEPNQIGPLELFLTSMGLNPSSTSLMYLSREVDNKVDAMQGKRTKLMRDAYFSRSNGEAWNDSINAIRRWNRDNRAFQISMADLVKSMKGRARNQANTHGGMLVPERYELWAREQNRFRGIPATLPAG